MILVSCPNPCCNGAMALRVPMMKSHRLNETGCRYIIIDAINTQKVFDYCLRNDFEFLFPSDKEELEACHPGKKTDGIFHLNTRLMYFDLIVLRIGEYAFHESHVI